MTQVEQLRSKILHQRLEYAVTSGKFDVTIQEKYLSNKDRAKIIADGWQIVDAEENPSGLSSEGYVTIFKDIPESDTTI